MLLQANGRLRYSPSDLITFLEGDFAAWMDRAQLERARGTLVAPAASALAPDVEDPELEILKRAGLDHEARFLAQLRTQGRAITEIPRDKVGVEATREAMLSGVEVIYQAHLEDGDFHGYPDFLFRVEGASSLGSWYYEPWDTKLARSAKPYFVVQLCAYSELLRAAQGVLPGRMGVRLGDHTDRVLSTKEFIHYFRHLQRSFLDFQASFDPLRMPDPGRERSWGQWSDAAGSILESRDHLRLVAGMTRGRIARLESAGIGSLTALAEGGAVTVPRIGVEAFGKLRAQAALQLHSRGLAQPLWEIVPPPADEAYKGLGGLPPADPHDIYFDMEGFPFAEEGLEYLFGAVTVEGGTPQFHDWWAHDAVEERCAFGGFVDWAWQRWRDRPGLHIYHYASYEVTRLRGLMGKYGTREDKVDDLLRHEVLVDLFKIVRQGVRVGTPSYSLKDVERIYRAGRKGVVTTAGGSVVEYQRWLDSGESRDWKQSPILGGIREYNRDDCVSTFELAEWLRARQLENAIPYSPPAANTEPPTEKPEPKPADLLVVELEAAAATAAEEEERRVTQLLAWLVNYHRREDKPSWWRLFDRRDATEEELFEDSDCLAAVELTGTPREPVARSWGHEYRFDPDQDTKIRAGDRVCFAHNIETKHEVVRIDEEVGTIVLKFSSRVDPPKRGSLIPFAFMPSGPIQEAIQRYATRHLAGKVGAGQAVDDLLRRRLPRIAGRPVGDLIDQSREILPQAADLIAAMDRTTLCIQGPPGTGKTYTSAHVIAALVRSGSRVGVSSNSHRAILKLMEAIADVPGPLVRLIKAGDEEPHPLIESGRIVVCGNDELALSVSTGPLVLGGTAWKFCRPDLEGALDYLFVDEAGQVPLANLVGMGLSARNIVLVGDQMQLAQPLQGTHPGESGSSCLVYALAGHATVPADRGVFLGRTRRMHPEVNRFISDAVYESRLEPDPLTARRTVELAVGSRPLGRGTGVVLIEVAHEGNTQDSDEEAVVVGEVLAQLRGGQVRLSEGFRAFDAVKDVVVVAPYNMQVRRLRTLLGSGIQIGSVDKFQGLEASVVVISMCGSTLEDAARGAEFLLSRNRLNVAVSRAQCLAVVVASPGLFRVRCTSIREMELMNLFCWLRVYAGDLSATRLT